MNLHIGLRALFEAPADGQVSFSCATSCFYRVWLNDHYVGYGPARTGRGHFRVDVWPVREYVQPGRNLLAIEAVSYQVNSYAAVNQPPFIQAEVVTPGKVLAATAGEGAPFAGVALNTRVQRVQRYSFQRPFIEVYRLAPDHDRWRHDPAWAGPEVAWDTQEEKKLLPRRAPLPHCERSLPVALMARGQAVARAPAEVKPWRNRSLTQIGPLLGGFPQDELELTVSDEMGMVADAEVVRYDGPDVRDPVAGFDLARGGWALLDFGVNQTGFIGVVVRCREPVRLQALFDELLGDDSQLDFLRLNAVNVVTWFLAAGDYRLESIEPYTMRYLKLLALNGACEVTSVYLRELACPDADLASFRCSDPDLDAIFEAGRETFRQNAVDIFMDCPSRERAGWLCDSYFTGRVEKALRGVNTIEHDFLENFAVADAFVALPEGMLPMCYPADQLNGNFIPNWALWLVLELDEFRARGGDEALVASFRDRVEALFRWFDAYVNADGLLEQLPGWIFIEWSRANDFVKGVNYPTNMLWAAALEAAGRLYDNPAWRERAGRVRQTIRDQAFDGEFFVDQALRDPEGRLTRTRNRTETCQYYAFFFGVADAARDAALWARLLDSFGPVRAQPDPHAGIHPSNMLIGNCLRLELLSRAGRAAQLHRELKLLFLPMARRTGTLWEHNKPTASCNHAFAAHAVCWLFRDILGCRLDVCGRTLRLHFHDTGLEHAAGVLPLADGSLAVQWRRSGGKLVCRVRTPADWRVETENRTGLELVLSVTDLDRNCSGSRPEAGG